MVQLMAEAAAGKTHALHLEPLAVSVLGANLHLIGALHQAELARHAETALRAVLLTGGGDNLRVNELDDILILPFRHIGLQHQHCPAQNTYLGRSQAHAVFVGQGLGHIVQQLVQARIELGHRAAVLVQCRLALYKNIPSSH